MKIDRLVSILLIILDKKKVTADELSKTFEVSIRTIHRDIDVLCTAGVPIYGEVGKNGGYHITENYKLDKSYISQKEVNVLVEILSGFKDTLFKDSIVDLLNKLSMLNEHNVLKRKLQIDTKPWGNNKRKNKILEDIYYATDHNLTLLYNYHDLYNKKTERQVQPYTIIMKGNSWYLYGYCMLRNDYRLFNINRIFDLQTGGTFTVREDVKPVEEIQIDRPRKTTPIKIKFSPSMRGRIPDFLDPKKEIIDEDGNTIYDIAFPVDEWLYSVILAFGHEAEVLKPDFIREEIHKRVEKILKIYKS